MILFVEFKTNLKAYMKV